MQRTGIAAILIILGIIILLFPLLGVVPLSLLTGISVIVLGLGLLFTGILSVGSNLVLGTVELVLGILALILGFGFLFDPALFSFVAALLVYLAGLFLIIAGIAAIATKTGGSRWSGVVPLILGMIYIVMAIYLSNPQYLGILIALWLLITGILMLYQGD